MCLSVIYSKSCFIISLILLELPLYLKFCSLAISLDCFALVSAIQARSHRRTSSCGVLQVIRYFHLAPYRPAAQRLISQSNVCSLGKMRGVGFLHRRHIYSSWLVEFECLAILTSKGSWRCQLPVLILRFQRSRTRWDWCHPPPSLDGWSRRCVCSFQWPCVASH